MTTLDYTCIFLPNSLSSNVVVVKLLQNRALLVWQVQWFVLGGGGAYQAGLDSCWEPGTGNVGQGAGGEDLALLLGAEHLTRFCLPAL